MAYVHRDGFTTIVVDCPDSDTKPVQPPDEARTRGVPAPASDGTSLYLAWRVVDDYPIAYTVLTGSEWSPVNTRWDVGTRTDPALGVAGRATW